MPFLGSKSLSFRDSLAESHHVIIQRVEDTNVAPPLRCVNARKSDGEEDNYRAQYQTCIQRRSGQIIVLVPPSVPSLPDPQVEDESEDDP